MDIKGTQVILGNEMGVDSLIRFSHQDAIRRFRGSLAILLSQLSQHRGVDSNDDELDENGTARDVDRDMFEISACPTCRPSAPMLQEIAYGCGASSCCSFDVYDKPFRFQPNIRREEIVTTWHLRDAAVILLYNMALSYHLKGAANANQRLYNFVKAERLYCMALTAVDTGGWLHFRNRVWVLLAINNNLGNIHSCLGHDDIQEVHLHDCLVRMSQLLLLFPSPLPRAHDLFFPFRMNVLLKDHRWKSTRHAAMA